ncbi:hypothetical protein [Caldanaerobacter subterraneus]|uniref:Uncharacterized protein n=1 Tax=Caldanaerobacter subterraneus TaxID=911092 RepID=A0A4R2KDA4_9THEO|nr:hypothetical protein [Caldanaerobacter subterraneus]TCO68236.1 hypothetical protein EV203_103133 [Caldanaerobacter subterraneus]
MKKILLTQQRNTNRRAQQVFRQWQKVFTEGGSTRTQHMNIQQSTVKERQAFQRPYKALIELVAFLPSFFGRAGSVFIPVHKTLR